MSVIPGFRFMTFDSAFRLAITVLRETFEAAEKHFSNIRKGQRVFKTFQKHLFLVLAYLDPPPSSAFHCEFPLRSGLVPQSSLFDVAGRVSRILLVQAFRAASPTRLAS